MKEVTEWEKELKEIRKTHIAETLMQIPIKKVPDSLVDSILMSTELDRAAEWFQKKEEQGKEWYRIDVYRRHPIALETYISLLHPKKKWTRCYSGKIKQKSEKTEDFVFIKRENWFVNQEKYKEWAEEMGKTTDRGIEIPGMTTQYQNGKITIVFYHR